MTPVRTHMTLVATHGQGILDTKNCTGDINLGTSLKRLFQCGGFTDDPLCTWMRDY